MTIFRIRLLYKYIVYSEIETIENDVMGYEDRYYADISIIQWFDVGI